MSVERAHGGEVWYIEARSYPSALMAKNAWERCNQKLMLGPGEEGASVWRLAPHTDDVPVIESGVPNEAMNAVVLVTQDRRVLAKAQRILGDSGESWDPVPGFCDTLIARRKRMMVGRAAYVLSHRPGGGSQSIRRPEDRGARIYESGEVREHPPGRG
jgi:hypothetical protein